MGAFSTYCRSDLVLTRFCADAILGTGYLSHAQTGLVLLKQGQHNASWFRNVGMRLNLPSY